MQFWKQKKIVMMMMMMMMAGWLTQLGTEQEQDFESGFFHDRKQNDIKKKMFRDGMKRVFNELIYC